jgi:hypothetical protein
MLIPHQQHQPILDEDSAERASGEGIEVCEDAVTFTVKPGTTCEQRLDARRIRGRLRGVARPITSTTVQRDANTARHRANSQGCGQPLAPDCDSVKDA